MHLQAAAAILHQQHQATTQAMPVHQTQVLLIQANHFLVITREQGSGTRDAFVELTGVLVKDGDTKTDTTRTDAVTVNGTEAVITNVKGNDAAIGYISLGSLNDSVKALKIEDVDATAENVKSGEYKISRPFNIAYKGRLKRSC